MNDAQLINSLFSQVRKQGYIKVSEAVNVSSQFHRMMGDIHKAEQVVRCWMYVLQQQ